MKAEEAQSFFACSIIFLGLARISNPYDFLPRLPRTCFGRANLDTSRQGP